MSTPVFPRPHPWRVVLWFLLALLAVIAVLQLGGCAGDPATVTAVLTGGAAVIAGVQHAMASGQIDPEIGNQIIAGVEQMQREMMYTQVGGGALGAWLARKPLGRVAVGAVRVAGSMLTRKPAGARPPAG